MNLVKAKDKNLKQSFNEPGVEIAFESVAHTYFYKGQQLESATGLIKKYLKPFDNDMVSFTSAKAWGVTKQEVQKIWADSGKSATDFGTVVHQMIENWFSNLGVGYLIAQSKSKKSGTYEDNYAYPKHPILKKILKDFEEVFTFEGLLISEALISDVKKGICGHADLIEIINNEKKICRIGDFKINIESDIKDPKNKILAPFDYLPSTKLSKYQLQMSIYANMLQASGWTVEGLDVYILENEWKHYKLDVLQVI